MALTKEAEQLLASMYKSYLEKRKLGESRMSAKQFGRSKDFQPVLVPRIPHRDVDDLCRELSCAKYLDIAFESGTVVYAGLSDKAIVYLENRFKDGFLSVVDFVSKFIP